jgi:hypothetical protein
VLEEHPDASGFEERGTRGALRLRQNQEGGGRPSTEVRGRKTEGRWQTTEDSKGRNSEDRGLRIEPHIIYFTLCFF